MATAALAAPTAAGGHAVDHTGPYATDRAAYTKTGNGAKGVGGDSAAFSGQHEGATGHLPGTRKNVRLLSSFEPMKPFGSVVEGQIADVSVHKTTAYLNSWDEPSCSRGGVYVVDISNTAAPRQLGFIPALAGNYHGEGAHVISASTRDFSGDLLAVNNEFCRDDAAQGGGFDLYDVSDPANPKVLGQGIGDRGREGNLGNPTGSGPANSYHSVFLWKDDGKVYAVGVDNVELHDVDIFDVTNPRAPKAIGEYDLLDQFPSIKDQSANNDEIFNHDMVVKEINGRDVMSVSYWDAGYVLLDVEDPAKPTLIRDSSFDGDDPLVPGIAPPEGNAHQSEFSHDDKWLLAADEDFSPYRPDRFSIDGAGEFPASEVGGGTSQASLPDRTLNGPTFYGGYGCPGASRIPQYDPAVHGAGLATDEEAILVLQRGPVSDADDGSSACFPGEKAGEADAKGWKNIIIINRHLGSESLDEAYCGSGGYPAGLSMVTLCISHKAGHALFDSAASYTTPYDDETEMAAIGTRGRKVTATSVFDGWGYAQLYRNSGTKMERVDSYALPESLDPAYAFGFGDLSIHEFATDPARNIAYVAYYSGGVRVVEFGEGGITEVGRFIHPEGNNFWGIEQFTTPSGKRLFAGSDRDHGLFLFEYTGK